MKMLMGTTAAALLLGAALVPGAHAQSLSAEDRAAAEAPYVVADDCDTATAPTSGEVNNEPRNRVSLLLGRAGSTQDSFWQALCRANNWAVQGGARGGNLNGDSYASDEQLVVLVQGSGNAVTRHEIDHPLQGQPIIDEDDATIMRLALESSPILLGQDGARLRAALLLGLQGDLSISDESFVRMLRDAWTLICTTSPVPVTLPTVVPEPTPPLCTENVAGG